jgi:hypothetical protein
VRNCVHLAQDRNRWRALSFSRTLLRAAELGLNQDELTEYRHSCFWRHDSAPLPLWLRSSGRHVYLSQWPEITLERKARLSVSVAWDYTRAEGTSICLSGLRLHSSRRHVYLCQWPEITLEQKARLSVSVAWDYTRAEGTSICLSGLTARPGLVLLAQCIKTRLRYICGCCLFRFYANMIHAAIRHAEWR